MFLFFLLLFSVESCPFDRINFQTVTTETLVEYYNLNRPFMLYNTNLSLTKDTFLKQYGNVTLKYGTRDSLRHEGYYAKSEIKVSNIDNVDGLIFTPVKDIDYDIEIPSPNFITHMSPYFLNGQIISYGHKKSGINYHWHSKALLAVIEGEKEWYIYPPLRENYIEYNVPNFHAIYCLQKKNTILFLPEYYWHRTSNRNTVFAIAWHERYLN
jgi:hypothetical protein